MAMGKRKRERQPTMWVPTTDLPMAMSHPFYARLNQRLREHGFDDFAETQCATFYADMMGRPSLPPGIYFRLLLIGYFEGIDSERGIAWRAGDSLALRDFLGVGLEATPDHSTISRTRRLIDLETHRRVTWILQCLSTSSLVKGKTIGIDATTLEANAALRSIVRRDSGESYEEFLTTLAKASGIGTPTRADFGRIDRKRKKKGSNDDWTHPHDPDAKITKMKDGFSCATVIGITDGNTIRSSALTNSTLASVHHGTFARTVKQRSCYEHHSRSQARRSGGWSNRDAAPRVSRHGPAKP
jgi:transposase